MWQRPLLLVLGSAAVLALPCGSTYGLFAASGRAG